MFTCWLVRYFFPSLWVVSCVRDHQRFGTNVSMEQPPPPQTAFIGGKILHIHAECFVLVAKSTDDGAACLRSNATHPAQHVQREPPAEKLVAAPNKFDTNGRPQYRALCLSCIRTPSSSFFFSVLLISTRYENFDFRHLLYLWYVLSACSVSFCD